jgi:hypothetical protein
LRNTFRFGAAARAAARGAPSLRGTYGLPRRVAAATADSARRQGGGQVQSLSP